MGISRKIFIGIKITPDLSFQLQTQAFVLEDLKLEKITYENKEYVGEYLLSASYRDFKELTHQISLKFSTLFPDKLFEPLSFSIIPQTLVG